MITKALRTKPVYKFYFYYKNYNFKSFKINATFKKKKWATIKFNSIQQQPIYLCHLRKLNIRRFYYYTFNNKQFLKKYLNNYKEYNFRTSIFQNFQTFERRLDYNLYKTNFIPSLSAARFYITHGYIFVNKQCIKNYNFLLHTNDVVTLKSQLINICKQTLIDKLIIKNEPLNYIPNLEIDFTTCSFIFLNKKTYKLLTLENQIKKVDFIRQKIQGQQNNYFQFFDYIFNYYLFFNIKANTYNNNNRVNLILKFLGFYFNDFYFRNLLLKQIVNQKYHYLVMLNTNFHCQNLQTNLQFFQLETNLHSNKLINSFFQYNWRLNFYFYIYLLKNLQFSNLQYFDKSIDYNCKILYNKLFFKLLQTKVKLKKYFQTYNKKPTQNFESTTYKILNYSTIIRKNTCAIKYLSNLKYRQLLLYIGSKQFKYKIYRKCTSFQQNDLKRQQLINYCRRALSYTYFNQIKRQNNSIKATKHELYNQLVLLKQNKLINQFKSNQRIYYPKQSFKYYTVYQNAIFEINKLQSQLLKTSQQIQLLQSILQLKNKQKLNYYYQILQQQLQFFNATQNVVNLNYNKYYNLLFLLISVLNQNQSTVLNFNIKLPITLFYKLHLKYIYTRKLSLNNKKTTTYYSQFNLQRFKISYIYIKYTKVRLLFSTVKQKYFTKIPYLASQYFCRNQLINLLKRKKSICETSVFENIRSQLFLSNLNVINAKNQFVDQYFFLDVILNLTVRKLNDVYNLFNNISYTIFERKQLNQFALILKKKIKKSEKKKNLNQYIYKIKIKKFPHYQKLYKLHISKYIQTKTQSFIFVKHVKQTNLYVQFKFLYTFYMLAMRKYKILKYFYNQYIWKEYTVFIDKIFVQSKLKIYNLDYMKTLYFNLLFTKLFNISNLDFLISTNYKYHTKLKLLINYFILIKRFYS